MRQTKPTGSTWTSRALVATLALAVAGSTVALTARSDYAFFDPLIDVKGLIARYAVEEPDELALQEAAIQGMLEALDDPYAVYVPADLNDQFNKQLTGEYVGIGAEVLRRDGAIEIISPLDDSPAFKAGVMAGDRVIAIDNEPTTDLSVDEGIDRLKGLPGTPVTLTIERGADILDITVERGEIQTRSVKGFARDPRAEGAWRYIIDPARRIAYTRITQFNPSAADEFAEAMDQIGAADGTLGALVIDMRWNLGGVLQTAERIADLFLDEGIIVSTRGRAHPEEITRATPEGTLPDFPIIVLLNERSASASEVLAGALAENGRAKVLGTRSFGKGSVQSVRALTGAASGAVLKLTEQRYYLPSGRSLHRDDDSSEWGVDPSPGFFMPMTDDQLRAMIEVRREADILRVDEGAADAAPSTDPAEILAVLKDPQLTAAVETLQANLDTGEWQTPTDESQGFDPVLARELAQARLAAERMNRQLASLRRRIAAIQSAADEETARRAIDRDILPDDAELDGGTITITGPDGETVTTLAITGDDLERWLIDAPVEPVEPDTP